MNKTGKIALSLLFWAAATLFWAVKYPYTLMFGEQNQLFLFSWNYLGQRLCEAGGFALYISEFFTQFNLYPKIGAALLSAQLVLLQILVWATADSKGKTAWYPLSFLPSLIILVQMGDIYTLSSHLIALILVLAAFLVLKNSRRAALTEVLAIPVLYWLAGPAVWIYVLIEIADKGSAKKLWMILWAAATIAAAYFTVMRQYPFKDVLLGTGYYGLQLETPALGLFAAALCVFAPFLIEILPETKSVLPGICLTVLLAAATVFGIKVSYQKDTHETIALDQLVRLEKWDDILDRAKKYQPESDIVCTGINLALFMAGRTDEAALFRQRGRSGIIMPRVRDFISNTTSYEIFWRPGMTNSSLRYAFDTQEAVMLNRKSGRHMSRMAQCHIVNGRYDLAKKYLDILSRSLFYGKWAKEQLALIRSEASVATEPVYAYLRSVRFQEDFLYYYPEMDKMLARLYAQNTNNQMAAYYYQLWVDSEE